MYQYHLPHNDYTRMWPGDIGSTEEIICLQEHRSSFSKEPYSWCKRECLSTENLKRRVPILDWLPKYDLDDFKGDLIAGATVAITVIPQGLAQASLANLPAQYGLYTAFMGCFIYAVFGSCKNITIGPTSVLSLMTANHVTTGGVTYCIILTFLAGCIMLLMGILNLGILLTFISSAVISGFTTAAALTIATTQLAGLFGMKFQSEGFIDDVKNFFIGAADQQIRYSDMAMGLSSIVFLLLLRYSRNINFHSCFPAHVAKGCKFFCWTLSTAKNAILVIICAGIAAALLANDIDALTLTKEIEPGLPPFEFPVFSYSYFNNATNQTIHKDFINIITDLGSGLIIIPLIAILETVAIAKSFANGKRIDCTQEMIALGMCNIMGSFVSSYPATGSFSRTAINYSSGVRTPAGGIVTGSLVLLALGVMSRYFRYIPKASLSAIIFVAVLNMVHYEDVILMWKTKKLDLIPFSATVIVSLFWGLEYGILIGVAISLCFLLMLDAKPKIIIEDKKTFLGKPYLYVQPDRSVLFPSAEYLQTRIRKFFPAESSSNTFAILLDCQHIMNADYTTALCCKTIINDFQDLSISVIFINIRANVHKVIEGALVDKLIHFPSLEEGETFVDALYIDREFPPVTHVAADFLNGKCVIGESATIDM